MLGHDSSQCYILCLCDANHFKDSASVEWAIRWNICCCFCKRSIGTHSNRVFAAEVRLGSISSQLEAHINALLLLQSQYITRF